MDLSSDSISNDNDFDRDLISEENENSIFLEKKRSITSLNLVNILNERNNNYHTNCNINLSINKLNSPELNKSYVEEYNENVKDENLKINNFDFDKFKNISIKKNLSLGKTNLEGIILNNYNGNKDIIKNIIKNIYDKKEKDAIRLLGMTFNEYLEIFIENNLKQFLEKEKENQIKNYKQKKYKGVIDKLI